MITFANFEKISNENCIIPLKERRKKIIEVRIKFREEQSKWEERRITETIRKVNLNQFTYIIHILQFIMKNLIFFTT